MSARHGQRRSSHARSRGTSGSPTRGAACARGYLPRRREGCGEQRARKEHVRLRRLGKCRARLRPPREGSGRGCALIRGVPSGLRRSMTCSPRGRSGARRSEIVSVPPRCDRPVPRPPVPSARRKGDGRPGFQRRRPPRARARRGAPEGAAPASARRSSLVPFGRKGVGGQSDVFLRGNLGRRKHLV